MMDTVQSALRGSGLSAASLTIKEHIETEIPHQDRAIREEVRKRARSRRARDPNSVKNFNARMARRKRIEAIARAEREKRRAEEDLEDAIRFRSTTVIYEGEEFVTRALVED